MSKRVDKNQREIVAGLREFGATVQVLSGVGKGCVDILCGFRGRSFPMEIKSGKGKLTPEEIEWHNNWKGDHYIVHDLLEAIDIITMEDEKNEK